VGLDFHKRNINQWIERQLLSFRPDAEMKIPVLFDAIGHDGST
jgi:hypothetical protein